MLGLPGMKARKSTPCLAFPIALNTSSRSAGVGMGFDTLPSFFLRRGTVFCGVFGENQTWTSPLGLFSSFTNPWVDFSFLLLARKPLLCSLRESPLASAVSFLRSFQYARYSRAR